MYWSPPLSHKYSDQYRVYFDPPPLLHWPHGRMKGKADHSNIWNSERKEVITMISNTEIFHWIIRISYLSTRHHILGQGMID